MSDLLFRDRAQHRLAVPLVDEHQRHARQHGDADVEGQRRGVVGRTGAHLHVGLIVVVAPDWRARGRRWDRAIDPFWTPGGAGGVHHLRTKHRIVDVAPVQRRQNAIVVLEARNRTADRHLQDQASTVGCSLLRRLDPRLGEQGLSLAVAHNVGDLLGGQVPVDRGDAKARPQGRRQHLDKLGAVGAEHGHRIAAFQSRSAQQPSNPVSVGVHLAEGSRAARRVVDFNSIRLHVSPNRSHHADLGRRLQAFA